MYHLIKCEELIPYHEGLQMQAEAYERVRNGESDGILFVLEHRPVYTIGARGGWNNLLCSEQTLLERGIDVVQVDRGGNITFHGPGQVVAYPVFDLSKLRKSARWYVSSLEQAVIDVLKQYGLEGSRKPEYQGVWIEDRKISAVGVRLKRWISTHGLSLNVTVDKSYFDLMNPCGITEFGITSMEDHRDPIDIDQVKEQLVQSFEDVFQIRFEA